MRSRLSSTETYSNDELATPKIDLDYFSDDVCICQSYFLYHFNLMVVVVYYKNPNSKANENKHRYLHITEFSACSAG